MKIALPSLLSVAKLVGLAQSAPLLTTQVFEGHVAASPVSLELSTSDNLAYGTLVYTRSKIAIQVVGTLSGSSLLMHEFDKRGTIVGIYSGKRTGKGFIGMWYSPSSIGKEMPFELRAGRVANALVPMEPTDLTGTYEYNFGPKARAATLLVQQADARHIWVALQGVTGEPIHHAATIDRTLLRLTGNQAVYSSVDKGKCAIKLTFFDGGACVDFLNESPTYGFDDAATLTGNYLRTDADLPLFQPLN